MFGLKSLSGQAQVPHVLNPKYTAGYVSIAERAMRFSFPAMGLVRSFPLLSVGSLCQVRSEQLLHMAVCCNTMQAPPP